MEVCPGFELIAIENAAALGHDLLELSKRPEGAVGERLIQTRPEVLSRLEFGRGPGQADEPDPIRHNQVRRDQGLSKAGNSRARRTAIELAWLWLRHQLGSAVARWFHERVGCSKGRMRRILLVAMARKLVMALWRFVTEGMVPSGAVLKA